MLFMSYKLNPSFACNSCWFGLIGSHANICHIVKGWQRRANKKGHQDNETFQFESSHCLLTDKIAKITIIYTLAHPYNKPVDLVSPVASIAPCKKQVVFIFIPPQERVMWRAARSWLLLWSIFHRYRSRGSDPPCGGCHIYQETEQLIVALSVKAVGFLLILPWPCL